MEIIDQDFEFIDLPNPIEAMKKLERIGRVCYKSEERITDNSYKPFIKNLIDRGHESILEHISITVKVICDRGVSHEIVRHRLASYAQEATHYCNYKGGIKVIEPGFWKPESIIFRNNPNYEQLMDMWLDHQLYTEKVYTRMIELGALPQEARTVLANSTKAELVITMNLREWRLFFKVRCPKNNQAQMRELAVLMLYGFNGKYPIIFEDILKYAD